MKKACSPSCGPSARKLHLLALVLALGTAAWSPSWAADPRASQFYEDALQRFDKKDFPGAVLQLKNVLKIDAKNLSAQVLLGRALLEDGEINAAEVAFVEALRLGVNRAEVVVPMAQALQRQGKPEVVLNDARFALEGLPRDVQFDLLLWHAAAATDLADFRRALKAVEDARALRPNDAASFRAEVPPRIRMRQFKEALAAADRAVSLAPNDADSHFVRGEALHVVPDLAKAMEAYDRALTLDPTHVGALVARAGVSMDFKRLDDASRDVAEVLKKAPRETRALYLKALIAQQQGRTADARAAYNEVTAQVDPIPAQYLRYRPQTQMLGGMSHHALGQREKAKPYLEGVLRSQPGNPVAKVLADIHLADRNTDAAIGVLDSYLRASPRDDQALLLLANAHLNAGRAPRAVQILQEALKQVDRPALRATLGLALVGAGRYAEAITELDAAYAKQPQSRPVGYTLASLYVQSGQAANALRVAQKLDATFPKDAAVLMLLGQARQLGGDTAGARNAFNAALQADPELHSARVQLARLDMNAGDFNKAVQSLNAVLARDDKQPEAVALIAELTERNSQLDQAERWLSRSDELAGPNNAGPALALVNFHLRHGQVPKAQEAMRRAQAKAPDGPMTLATAGRVALAAGDANAARTALGRAATAAGFNVPQLTEIAALQLQAGPPQAAAHSLDKALGERPDHVPALALRAQAHLAMGELVPAEQRIKRIQTLQPRAGLGWALAGELATARKQPDVALAAYRRAHELDRSTVSFMRLFSATAARDNAGAIRLAEQWVGTRPRDAVVWRALADSQFNAGNLAGARRSYETLLKIENRDADALNNLAHVLMRQKDAGALKVAEQALAAAPSAPHVLGTAGWASFQAGQNDRALQLLRESRLRDPANADTRFFLASVLAALGRHGEARTELTAALADGQALSYRTEAQQLLTKLR
jgi:putative PEP-CTERM system TPR-repeat lipoprotein